MKAPITLRQLCQPDCQPFLSDGVGNMSFSGVISRVAEHTIAGAIFSEISLYLLVAGACTRRYRPCYLRRPPSAAERRAAWQLKDRSRRIEAPANWIGYRTVRRYYDCAEKKVKL